ncbi:MAG TPA: hypothetical protein IGS17_20205 [Oscillatoriales cyanobacterium M59_W2019_021]|nr:MAG: hypothetical protein D6728_01285 [Cyanobacteria bacterium J055]HIK33526.1 hypothetical protein [Oscillatoriales cyanobacterium M4454_W2019_049]HIK53216.1 hypothetical protein [Oscillatoriales cyanobacterium M59_W2019_021]
MPSVQLIPGALSEMIATVAETKVLTRADRYGLMAALLDESLSEEELEATNRLVRAVLKGRVKVLDRISVEV